MLFFSDKPIKAVSAAATKRHVHEDQKIEARQFTTVADFDVTVNLTHPHLNQVQIVLISPTGQQFTLVNNGVNASGNSTGLGLADAANMVVTVFDDQAARSITAGTAPYTGHFRAENVERSA